MIEVGRGHIVFINSMLGIHALAGAADYTASKFASLGLTDSLIVEMKRDGHDKNIHVTSVHPYLIDTELFAGCKPRSVSGG